MHFGSLLFLLKQTPLSSAINLVIQRASHIEANNVAHAPHINLYINAEWKKRVRTNISRIRTLLCRYYVCYEKFAAGHTSLNPHSLANDVRIAKFFLQKKFPQVILP